VVPDDFFLPELQKHGYSGIFKPKIHSPAVVRSDTSFRSAALSYQDYCGTFASQFFLNAILLLLQKYGYPPDGCAVFFRASRLQLSGEAESFFQLMKVIPGAAYRIVQASSVPLHCYCFILIFGCVEH
jgi:mRNA deadenylase 3'-5' endonuclease subunit Ccr4